MVSGLIKKQQVWLWQQDLAQAHPHLPATTATFQICVLMCKTSFIQSLDTCLPSEPGVYSPVRGPVLAVSVPATMWVGAAWIRLDKLPPTFASRARASIALVEMRSVLPQASAVLWKQPWAMSSLQCWKHQATGNLGSGCFWWCTLFSTQGYFPQNSWCTMYCLNTLNKQCVVHSSSWPGPQKLCVTWLHLSRDQEQSTECKSSVAGIFAVQTGAPVWHRDTKNTILLLAYIDSLQSDIHVSA